MAKIKTFTGKVRTLLSGKKTFIIALLLIALGILKEDPQVILEGLGAITIRTALKK